MRTPIDSEWFSVLEQEIVARAAGVVLPDREQWLSEHEGRTETEWEGLVAYLSKQSRIASVVAPTLGSLSWTTVPHEYLEEAGRWPTPWDCWRAGATMRLPYPAMMLEFADPDPYRIEAGPLTYLLYGAIITPAPEAGIIVHAIGGPSVWEGMLHYAPFALVPDAVASGLVDGSLPWGYDEAVVRTPGSSAVLPPRRARPELLMRWSGGIAAAISVGVLRLGEFDTDELDRA